MERCFGGVQTPHSIGEFAKRRQCDCYCIFCFNEPFLYEKDGALVRGEAGDLLINTPGSFVYHGPIPGAKTGFVNDWIYLSGIDLRSLLNKYPLPLNTAFHVDQKHILRTLILELLRESATEEDGVQDRLHYLIGTAIIDLYRLYNCTYLKQKVQVRLEEVRKEMLRSPEKNWSLETLAQYSGYSVSRFCALYKDYFGVPPKQELLSARLSAACRLLKYTNSSVSDIAESCGFQSIGYFSRYFKQEMGLTPREYARNITERFLEHKKTPR